MTRTHVMYQQPNQREVSNARETPTILPAFEHFRQAALEHAVQQMVAESRGLHGPGVVAFQILGAGHGNQLFLNAELGDLYARSVVQACLEYVEHTGSALPGAVKCLLCGGGFAVPPDQPWAVLVLHAAVPEPTIGCCSGICTTCCTAMDWGELRRQIMRRYRMVFPMLRELPQLAEPAHA